MDDKLAGFVPPGRVLLATGLTHTTCTTWSPIDVLTACLSILNSVCVLCYIVCVVLCMLLYCIVFVFMFVVCISISVP